MNDESKKLLNLLTKKKIKFSLKYHPAFFTVKESKSIKKNMEGAHTKNLFLKNKKNNFFLLSCKDDTIIDLKKIKKNPIFGNISFANEFYLKKHLNLTPGSVTPFGLLFDLSNIVEFYLDNKLLKYDVINFHPLINTSTIGLKTSEFIYFMKLQKKVVNYFNFDTYEIIYD